MKKWISLLCVCMLILGTITASVVSASAEDKGEIAVDVKSGDKVTYILKLDKVNEPIVGSDFSVYYDSSVFSLESVADFNDNTDSDEWTAVINPDMDGQVRGVWSILKGVDFSSKRNFITLNLKAKEDASDSHITYRIRFLYGNSAFDEENPKDFVTPYEFTVDVLVNGTKVIDDDPAEWEEKEPAEPGKFTPSPDGKSEHADASLSGVTPITKKKSGSGSAQSVGGNVVDGDNGSGGSGGNGGNNGSDNEGGGSNAGGSNAGGGSNLNNGSKANANGNNDAGSAANAAPPATTSDGYFVIATDSEGNVVATSDEAPEMATTGNNDKGGSPVLWIIIVLVVLAGGGAAVYFFVKKKPADKAAAPAPEAQPVSDSADTAEAVTVDETAPEVAPEAEVPAQDEKTQLADDDEKTQLADDPSDSENQ